MWAIIWRCRGIVLSLQRLTIYSIEIATMEQNDYLRFSEDGKTLIRCKKDYKGAVVIPDGVTKIEAYAFAGCSGITPIEISKKSERIGYMASFSVDVLKNGHNADIVKRDWGKRQLT